ncbi:WD40 repeat-like protein [Sistotremastrum suecicum HHB10207 ss-3]|uniref:WD40 repeat-like protein n=1 Tax=Sistotremastrum suecicum HHB10207 ss-3 TaxID=1314776 RepID=A0A166F9U4_9AGAM|nr:WD40 repeat-like protein [Sistotremastrum suecicum HHB10207 ss-3]
MTTKTPDESEAKNRLQISEIRGFNFPKAHGMLKAANRFSLALECGTEKHMSEVSKRNDHPFWDQEFVFNSESTVLVIKAYIHHSLGKDELVGELSEDIKKLTASADADGSVRVVLKVPKGSSAAKNPPEISFKISLKSRTENMTAAVEAGKAGWQDVKKSPGLLDQTSKEVVTAAKIQSTITAAAADVTPFLDKLDKFVKLVDNISEVHPYAKVAWSVISAAYKIFQAQKQRDGAIAHLIDVMDDTYAFVIESKELFQVESQRKLLETLANQTTECGHFIVDYAKNKTFGGFDCIVALVPKSRADRANAECSNAGGRTLTNILGEADGVIKGFESSFSDLKAAIQLRGSVQTEIVVFQTIKLTKDIAIDINLNDMQYVGDASFLPEKACFPGTRTEIIETITQWVIQPDQSESASLFWLKGFAGSGKSAVAHTIAHRFHSGKRLGSSYIFDESQATERRADTVFSKISRDLAAISDGWKDSLGKIIKNSPDLRHTPSVRRQFEELILGPARDVMFIGPILIVIDALDECGGTPDARKELLRILATRLSELPSNFCILLTSRPQKEFEDAFSHSQYVTPLDILAASESSVDKDLAVYYESRLGDLAELDDAWPNKGWLSELVKRSEGLFQWAFTACEYVLEPGWSPDEQLRNLFSSTSSSAELAGLDNLYKAILHNIFQFSVNDGRIARFRSILGRILCARTPLTVADLMALHGPDESPSMIKSIVLRMGSVLSGVSTDSAPVQALHTSFRDFLFSQERSDIYHIDPLEQERSLAKTCVTLLNKELRVNISKTQTSYTSGPSLNDTVVPPYLMYSARFWSDHLITIPFSQDVVPLVQTFTTQHFLHWLELLCLYDEVYRARNAMRALQTWILGQNQVLFDFGIDAEKFINAFANIIGLSPPHLYLSALPFAPTTSLVAKHFLPGLENTLSVQAGKQQTYPALVNLLGTPSNLWSHTINSLYCNRNNIMSVSSDGSVVFWDLGTGHILGEIPSEDQHTYNVGVISHDRQYFALGSYDGDIYLHDFQTHAALWGPVNVHGDAVSSLSFTADSTILWAASSEGYVGGFHVMTGAEVCSIQRLHTDTVYQARFAPNATHVAIAAGTDKGTEIIIFEHISIETTSRNRTGMQWLQVPQPPIAATRTPCLAISAGAQFIGWVSPGRKFGIWDTAKKEGKTLFEEALHLCAVDFSQDGDIIATAWSDDRIRLWETKSGSFQGLFDMGSHSSIRLLQFCFDASQIATGSSEGTIAIWDTTAAVIPHEVREPLELYLLNITPDGGTVFTKDSDATIRAYDLESGNESSPPQDTNKLGCVVTVSYSLDMKRLAVALENNDVLLWDAETWTPIGNPMTGHTDRIACLTFSPDGQRLATGGHDYLLCIWDTTTNQMVTEPFTGHIGSVSDAQFFGGRKRIASCSAEDIRIWDTESGKSIGEPLEFHDDLIFAFAMSPDRDRAASGSCDGIIHIWDTTTLSCEGQPKMNHESHIVWSLAFSSDGGRLLSTGQDHTIRIWDAHTGQLIGIPMEDQSGPVVRAVFANSDRDVVSLSSIGTIRVWSVDFENQAMGSACERELRTLFPRFRIDGWVCSDEDPAKLLFWVPPHYRSTFLWGRCKRLIGAEPTIIDFERFQHGENWTKCLTPSSVLEEVSS